ncbi:MAG TPA: glycoside hydrolase family 1 protein [Methylomirabilota bacterium]|nr:glycoside hydrolase family 1 protein [Methylomirabilota bacterium]
MENLPETKLQFPAGFLLGAASAAHQVEGNNIHSDWWEYEQKGRLPKSGEACDHYNRYEEDFGLAQEIGLNAMRISIEWARIEPEAGKWNAQAIEHYKKVLISMKEHGLTRVVTLWHWTLPKWFADQGGFENKQGVEAFARFAWFVAQNLGREIDLWITLNEPEVYVLSSYKQGVHPPFEKSIYLSWRVTENLIEAHKAAYKAIKEALGNVPVGLAKNSAYYAPYRKNNPADRLATYIARALDGYLLEKIQNQLDFIGLNYYFYNSIKFDWRTGYKEMNGNFNEAERTNKDMSEYSDMGWFLYPEGIYYVLKNLKKFHKPIYITENGLADSVDSRRPKFLRETFKALMNALKDGVDLKGYLHWTLTDNYEWHNGFGPRFGLIEMDYVSQQRKIRPSAAIFKEIKIS